MKVFPKILAVGVVACMATTAFAADHRDGDAVQAPTDPAVDINDVYSFTDGTDAILAMNVYPFAENVDKFSDVTEYVFHVTSASAFGMADGTKTDIICTFDAAQAIQCWIGTTDYVTGDASDAAAPLVAADTKFSVYAGLRADPFFFYLQSADVPPTAGFKGARSAAVTAIPGIPIANFFASGCVHGISLAAITAKLTTAVQTDNNFAAGNVLAISLKIDQSLLVDAAHPFYSVWASTNVTP